AYVIQLFTRVPVQDEFGGTVFWLAGAVTDALEPKVGAGPHGQGWGLVTYALLHHPGGGFAPGGGCWHHDFNMLFLFWFGRDLEEMYGPREFLAFYLVSALVGGVAFLGTGALTGSQNCIGASGAVTAVMVLCALHFPHRTILLFFVLPIPLWVFVGFQVVQDTFLFVDQAAGGAQALKSQV